MVRVDAVNTEALSPAARIMDNHNPGNNHPESAAHRSAQIGTAGPTDSYAQASGGAVQAQESNLLAPMQPPRPGQQEAALVPQGQRQVYATSTASSLATPEPPGRSLHGADYLFHGETNALTPPPFGFHVMPKHIALEQNPRAAAGVFAVRSMAKNVAALPGGPKPAIGVGDDAQGLQQDAQRGRQELRAAAGVDGVAAERTAGTQLLSGHQAASSSGSGGNEVGSGARSSNDGQTSGGEHLQGRYIGDSFVPGWLFRGAAGAMHDSHVYALSPGLFTPFSSPNLLSSASASGGSVADDVHSVVSEQRLRTLCLDVDEANQQRTHMSADECCNHSTASPTGAGEVAADPQTTSPAKDLLLQEESTARGTESCPHSAHPCITCPAWNSRAAPANYTSRATGSASEPSPTTTLLLGGSTFSCGDERGFEKRQRGRSFEFEMIVERNNSEEERTSLVCDMDAATSVNKASRDSSQALRDRSPEDSEPRALTLKSKDVVEAALHVARAGSPSFSEWSMPNPMKVEVLDTTNYTTTLGSEGGGEVPPGNIDQPEQAIARCNAKDGGNHSAAADLSSCSAALPETTSCSAAAQCHDLRGASIDAPTSALDDDITFARQISPSAQTRLETKWQTIQEKNRTLFQKRALPRTGGSAARGRLCSDPVHNSVVTPATGGPDAKRRGRRASRNYKRGNSQKRRWEWENDSSSSCSTSDDGGAELRARALLEKHNQELLARTHSSSPMEAPPSSSVLSELEQILQFPRPSMFDANVAIDPRIVDDRTPPTPWSSTLPLVKDIKYMTRARQRRKEFLSRWDAHGSNSEAEDEYTDDDQESTFYFGLENRSDEKDLDVEDDNSGDGNRPFAARSAAAGQDVEMGTTPKSLSDLLPVDETSLRGSAVLHEVAGGVSSPSDEGACPCQDIAFGTWTLLPPAAEGVGSIRRPDELMPQRGGTVYEELQAKMSNMCLDDPIDVAASSSSRPTTSTDTEGDQARLQLQHLHTTTHTYSEETPTSQPESLLNDRSSLLEVEPPPLTGMWSLFVEPDAIRTSSPVEQGGVLSALDRLGVWNDFFDALAWTQLVAELHLQESLSHASSRERSAESRECPHYCVHKQREQHADEQRGGHEHIVSAGADIEGVKAESELFDPEQDLPQQDSASLPGIDPRSLPTAISEFVDRADIAVLVRDALAFLQAVSGIVSRVTENEMRATSPENLELLIDILSYVLRLGHILDPDNEEAGESRLRLLQEEHGVGDVQKVLFPSRLLVEFRCANATQAQEQLPSAAPSASWSLEMQHAYCAYISGGLAFGGSSASTAAAPITNDYDAAASSSAAAIPAGLQVVATSGVGSRAPNEQQARAQFTTTTASATSSGNDGTGVLRPAMSSAASSSDTRTRSTRGQDEDVQVEVQQEQLHPSTTERGPGAPSAQRQNRRGIMISSGDPRAVRSSEPGYHRRRAAELHERHSAPDQFTTCFAFLDLLWHEILQLFPDAGDERLADRSGARRGARGDLAAESLRGHQAAAGNVGAATSGMTTTALDDQGMSEQGTGDAAAPVARGSRGGFGLLARLVSGLTGNRISLSRSRFSDSPQGDPSSSSASAASPDEQHDSEGVQRQTGPHFHHEDDKAPKKPDTHPPFCVARNRHCNLVAHGDCMRRYFETTRRARVVICSPYFLNMPAHGIDGRRGISTRTGRASISSSSAASPHPSSSADPRHQRIGRSECCLPREALQQIADSARAACMLMCTPNTKLVRHVQCAACCEWGPVDKADGARFPGFEFSCFGGCATLFPEFGRI
ncbi:unnamed protein product [Amoebophrya sp. A25]|nr:unnamed protein product [Amoebophrya sp. A25]|eukprot:GSA25T00013331001.1